MTQQKEKKGCFYFIKLGGLIILAALVFGAVLNSLDKGKETGTVSSTPGAGKPTSGYQANIGDAVTTEKFEISVTAVSARSAVGNEFFRKTASDGGVYVAVEWVYKNVTDKPISSWRAPSLYLRDAAGTEYKADLAASASFSTERNIDAKVLSDLNPGIRVKDVEVFEVSRDLIGKAGWHLVINAGQKIEIPLALQP